MYRILHPGATHTLAEIKLEQLVTGVFDLNLILWSRNISGKQLGKTFLY